MGVILTLDIKLQHLKLIKKLIAYHLPNTTVWAYGSRVKWTAQTTSDLDMVAFIEPTQTKNIYALKDAFSESDLPFKVDLLAWHSIPKSFHSNIKEMYFVIQENKLGISDKKLSDIVNFNLTYKIKKNEILPFIDMASLSANNRDVKKITEKQYKGSGSQFKNGDTLFARITPCLENGKTAKVNCLPQEKYGFGSTEFIVMSAKQPEYDENYLYYLARLPDFRMYAKTFMAGTSGRQRVAWQSLAEYRFDYPNKKIRQAAGETLKVIDDKIELNQKMNQTLEEIAKTLFKSWFIDFEPVKAKAEGRPTGLSKEISDLFPDSFEDSELGKIPKGWDVKKISDLGKIICGKTPPTKDKENYGEGYNFITIPDMHNQVFALTASKQITEKGASTLKGKLLPNNSVCVSCIATPGLTVLIDSPSFTNQQINSIILHNTDYSFYLYSIFKHMGANISIFGGGGSVFENMSKSKFENIQLLFANIDLINAFNLSVKFLFEKIKYTSKEISVLQNIRDTLLPKLISGELRIPDAEQFIEANIND